MIFAAVVWIEAPAQAEAFQVGFICFVFVCVFACIGKAWRLSVPHGQDKTTPITSLSFFYRKRRQTGALRVSGRRGENTVSAVEKKVGGSGWTAGQCSFGLVWFWYERKRKGFRGGKNTTSEREPSQASVLWYLKLFPVKSNRTWSLSYKSPCDCNRTPCFAVAIHALACGIHKSAA